MEFKELGCRGRYIVNKKVLVTQIELREASKITKFKLNFIFYHYFLISNLLKGWWQELVGTTYDRLGTQWTRKVSPFLDNKFSLTLTRPIGWPPHTPVAQKIADKKLTENWKLEGLKLVFFKRYDSTPSPWKRRKTTSSATLCTTGVWGLIIWFEG